MILDTNAVSSLVAGDEDLRRLLVNIYRHHLTSTVVGEYQFGLNHLPNAQHPQRQFNRLVSYSDVLPCDLDTAYQYASIKSELKAKGHPIPSNDVCIAAVARQHDLEIVSRDGHFDQVSGVRRVDW